MKTILWAALSANGNYAKSSPEHPPKAEALDDFWAHAGRAGNFIVGRRTFEAFLAGGGGQPPAGIDIVVISSGNVDIPGVTHAATPQEALDFLAKQGHETAVLAGGATLHNAFLAQGLVDELVFNIAPVLEDRGLNVLLPDGHYEEVQLLDCKTIGGGIVHLRYAVSRA